MARKAVDLTGKVFGKLTILSEIKDRYYHYNCLCDCGKTKQLRLDHIKRLRSCGCSIERRYTDITGQTFGYLTVISLDHEKINKKGRTERYYRCSCKCGNEKVLKSHYLTSGGNKELMSCGCLKKERSRQDLVGKKFNKLTVISFHGYKGSNILWDCLCECGGTKLVSSNHLRTGGVASCGCLKQAKDLTGQKFGEWLVLKRLGSNKYKTPMWECQCSCGVIRNHQASNLLSGSSTSCGCAKQYRDDSGQKFGRLTILSKIQAKDSDYSRYVCLCDCGNYITPIASNIVRGLTTSCGCHAKALKVERNKVRMTTHGKSRSKVYRTYQGMIERCYNPNVVNYHMYGGRGITVCDRWLESFENFYEDMGDPPSDNLSIDRVFNALGYSKDNCKWSTSKEQTWNTRANRLVTFQGETKCIGEWVDILTKEGLMTATYSAVACRLSRGWTVEDAFFTPLLRIRRK